MSRQYFNGFVPKWGSPDVRIWLLTDYDLKPQLKDWGFFTFLILKNSHTTFNSAKNVQLWELLTTHDLNAFRADKRNPSTVAGALSFLS